MDGVDLPAGRKRPATVGAVFRDLRRPSEFESFGGLLAAAQSGDEHAWSVLYQSVAGRLLGYLRARGAIDPEGLLGETFLQLARNLRKFDGDEAGFRSWAFTVAHHRLIDERRHLRRRASVPIDVAPETDFADSSVDVEQEAIAGIEQREVEAILQVLNDEQREVVLLRVLGGLSAAETAAATGKSEGAVRVLQHRALRLLKERLTKDVTP